MTARPVDNRIPKLPRRSIAYMVFCLAGILIFFLAGLLPNQRQITALDREIERLNQELKKQAILFPAFQKVHQTMQRREKQILPFPEKKQLSIERMGDLPSMLQQMAAQSGLIYHKAVPELNTLKSGLGRLRIGLSLGGDLPHFNDFLIRLGNFAYLDEVETITVNSENAVKEFGLQLSFWIEK